MNTGISAYSNRSMNLKCEQLGRIGTLRLVNRFTVHFWGQS